MKILFVSKQTCFFLKYLEQRLQSLSEGRQVNDD